MSVTEAAEKKRTHDALNRLWLWVKPETNEGITFSLARLPSVLNAKPAVFGGGDVTRFNPSTTGPRGTLSGNGYSSGNTVDGGSIGPSFPFDIAIDLNTGIVTGSWNPPNYGPQSFQFELELLRVDENMTSFIFYSDKTNEEAVYTMAFVTL
jgi:hypothetical protein